MEHHRNLARPLRLILSLATLWLLLRATPAAAAASPPDWLSPPTVTQCKNPGGTTVACEAGNILDLDATVDGATVAFASSSNQLIPHDTNAAMDIFVWHAGTVQRVSVGADGTPSNGVSDRVAISGDGRYVYFRSFAGNLVAGTQLGQLQLYLKEVATGKLRLISRDRDGQPIHETSSAAHFNHLDTNYNGRYVVFASEVTNYLPDLVDTNVSPDVFLADVDPDGNGDYFDEPPRLYLLSARADGITAGNGFSMEPTISQRGDAVAWLTRADDLAPGLASNGATVDVLLARLGIRPDGSIDPTTRTLIAINRMGNDATTLTPHHARLPRLDPWRDQVAYVTASAIPGTGDDHIGQDLYLSVGDGSGQGARDTLWASNGYSTTAPVGVSMAWDPHPAAATAQVAWVGQAAPRTVDDLLIQRTTSAFPVGWPAVNWLAATTPSDAPVLLATLSADGRYAFWTTRTTYDYPIPADSIHLFRRAIAPPQSVPLTVNAVGGSATYTPVGVPVGASMLYSPTLVVTLTPQAATGYRFRAWEGVDSRMGMTATVLVYAARTVTATFDAMTPPVMDDLVITTPEDTPVSGINLTVSDPDPDESHTITLAQPPSHGDASVDNHSVAYQPATDFNGQDSFTLQVTDAYGLQLATPAQVTVLVTPVGDAPALADLTLTVAEDTPLPAIALNLDDPDPDDKYTVAIAHAPAHGTVALPGAAASNPTLGYESAPNFHGQDSFALQVTDAYGLSLTAPAWVTVTVTPVNDAPTVSDAQGSGENTGGVTLVPVTTNDDDADDSHTLTVVTPPVSGTVRLRDAGGPAHWGELDAPYQTQATFEYTPLPDFAGVDSFVFAVTDSGKASITATATITVTAPVTVIPTPPATTDLHLPVLRGGPSS